MRTFLRAGVLLLSGFAPLGLAQDVPETPPAGGREQVEPAGAIDATKWCVYAGVLYSPGAVIAVAERRYICVEGVDTRTDTERLVWRLES